MTDFYQTPAWKALRRAALRRDGYRCAICKRDVSGKGQSRVDHVRPVSTHPHLALSLANLRVLCANHDNQSHREKWRGAGAAREEKFVITGCDANGVPLDPAHHWRQQF
jgi:5-methylcytosine-specific restriction endonuclease McrA